MHKLTYTQIHAYTHMAPTAASVRVEKEERAAVGGHSAGFIQDSSTVNI